MSSINGIIGTAEISLKTRNGRFPSKIALHLKKTCMLRFLCVNTVSDKVLRHSLAI